VATNEKQRKVENAYGSHKGNWGDRSIFQGDYINFGYWQNETFNKVLTEGDRIRSSAALYKYVIDKLNVSRSDTVLELGCGRAVGMLDAFRYTNMGKIIGIDITRAQIDRAKIKKDRLENKNLREKLKAEELKQRLGSLEKQWELVLADIRGEKEEFKKEMEILSQKIEELKDSKEAKTLEQQVKLFDSAIKKETDLERFKQDWTEGIQENRKSIAQVIATKDEMIRKIGATELLVASADSTGLEDHSINKIYSVEVFQHIEDFNSLASEIRRILAPDGIVSFCAHLATNRSSYNKLRQEKLLLDEIEILIPVDEVVNAFEENGFNVSHHSIGACVFEGYEQWITQIRTSDVVSHNIYDSYKSVYIDYYMFILNQLDEDGNRGMCLDERDEL
jgi:cyclopropane fatty-acyl-phospholipid synthase-like methyltransferase